MLKLADHQPNPTPLMCVYGLSSNFRFTQVTSQTTALFWDNPKDSYGREQIAGSSRTIASTASRHHERLYAAVSVEERSKLIELILSQGHTTGINQALCSAVFRAAADGFCKGGPDWIFDELTDDVVGRATEDVVTLLCFGADPNSRVCITMPASSRHEVASPEKKLPVQVTLLVAALLTYRNFEKARRSCTRRARKWKLGCSVLVRILLDAGANPNEEVRLSMKSAGFKYWFPFLYKDFDVVAKCRRSDQSTHVEDEPLKHVSFSAISVACMWGLVEAAKVLLAKGSRIFDRPSPNVDGDVFRLNPFHEIMRYSNVNESGVSVELTTRRGTIVALFDCLWDARQDKSSVQESLNGEGWTPLHAAVSQSARSSVSLLEYLVQKEPRFVKCVSTEGLNLTPLALACWREWIEPGVIKRLLKHGSDPNHMSAYWNIRSYAFVDDVCGGDVCGPLLFESGDMMPPISVLCADPMKDPDGGGSFSNKRDRQCAALQACLTANTPADVHTATPLTNRTPLYFASGTADLAMVELLLEQGSDPNVIETMNGATPALALVGSVQCIASMENSEYNRWTIRQFHMCLERLANYNADFNVVADTGDSVLSLVCGSNHTFANQATLVALSNKADFRRLFRSGAPSYDGGSFPPTGYTTLQVACRRGWREVIRTLIWKLDAGKDSLDVAVPNCPLEESPLYLMLLQLDPFRQEGEDALNEVWKGIVENDPRYLIFKPEISSKKRFDLQRDQDGRTLVHIAAMRAQEISLFQLVHFVKKVQLSDATGFLKAMVNAKDKDGATPLHHACGMIRQKGYLDSRQTRADLGDYGGSYRLLWRKIMSARRASAALLVAQGSSVFTQTIQREGYPMPMNPVMNLDVRTPVHPVLTRSFVGMTPLFIASLNGLDGIVDDLKTDGAPCSPHNLPYATLRNVVWRALERAEDDFTVIRIEFDDNLANLSLAELGLELNASFKAKIDTRHISIETSTSSGVGVVYQWAGEFARQMLTCTSPAQAARLSLPQLDTLFSTCRSACSPPPQHPNCCLKSRRLGKGRRQWSKNRRRRGRRMTVWTSFTFRSRQYRCRLQNTFWSGLDGRLGTQLRYRLR